MKQQQQNWYEVTNYYGNPVANLEYIIASNLKEAKEKMNVILKERNIRGAHSVKRCYNGGVRG
jgi:hypothetical protein